MVSKFGSWILICTIIASSIHRTDADDEDEFFDTYERLSQLIDMNTTSDEITAKINEMNIAYLPTDIMLEQALDEAFSEYGLKSYSTQYALAIQSKKKWNGTVAKVVKIHVGVGELFANKGHVYIHIYRGRRIGITFGIKFSPYDGTMLPVNFNSELKLKAGEGFQLHAYQSRSRS